MYLYKRYLNIMEGGWMEVLLPLISTPLTARRIGRKSFAETGTARRCFSERVLPTDEISIRMAKPLLMHLYVSHYDSARVG